MTQPTAFSEIVRTRRSELGISQRAIARTLGITQTYVSQVEQGQRGIRNPERLQQLADMLRISVDTLHIARGEVPTDVVRILLDRPQLIAAVRTMNARLSARDNDTQ